MTPFGQPPAFRLEVQVCKPEPLDPVSGGPVRLVSISGGRVLGSLNGRILPGGTDWQTIGPDGTIEIEVVGQAVYVNGDVVRPAQTSE